MFAWCPEFAALQVLGFCKEGLSCWSLASARERGELEYSHSALNFGKINSNIAKILAISEFTPCDSMLESTILRALCLLFPTSVIMLVASLSVDVPWVPSAKWLMSQECLSPHSAQLCRLGFLGLCFSADIKQYKNSWDFVSRHFPWFKLEFSNISILQSSK